jgi:hypothetical protein
VIQRKKRDRHFFIQRNTGWARAGTWRGLPLSPATRRPLRRVLPAITEAHPLPRPASAPPRGRRPLLHPRGQRPFLLPRAPCFPRSSSPPELSGDGGAEPSFLQRHGEGGGGAAAGRASPRPHHHRRLLTAPLPRLALLVLASRSALARRVAAAAPRLPPAQLTPSSELPQSSFSGRIADLPRRDGSDGGRGMRRGLAAASEPKRTSTESLAGRILLDATARPRQPTRNFDSRSPCVPAPAARRRFDALLEPVRILLSGVRRRSAVGGEG